MGLIAHYRLDNSAEDWIGGRDGQINGEVQWVKGALGGALDLTGGSKWVTGDGWPITGDFSYSFWAKQISATSIGGLVGNHWHTNGPTGVNVYFSASLTQVTIATADGTSRPSYTVNLITPNTEWCHYAVTCRGGWVSVYQNGQHLDTRHRVIVQDKSRAWAIGRWTASYDSYYYEGLIDDVRIYDHALSPREVRDLSLGLVAHYPLISGIEDASGRSLSVGHNVTLTSGGCIFDGETSYIDAGSEGHLNVTESLTMTAWVNLSSLGNWKRIFMRSSHDQYQMDISTSGKLRMEVWDAQGNVHRVNGNTSLAENTWFFCVTVVDSRSGHIRLYVNALLEDEKEWVGPIVSLPSASANIGRDTRGAATSYLHGVLRDVRVYATALTAAQVKEFYQQRASIDSGGSVHSSLIKEGGRGGVEFTGGDTSSFGADGDFLEASSVVEVFPEVERTLEFWVYPTKDASSNIIISLHTEDAISDRTYIDDNNTQGDFRFYAGGTRKGTINNVWEFDRWQHIALVFSSSGISAYRDGIEVGSTSATWDLGSLSPTTLQIGRGYHSSGARYFVGRMSDFRIWGKSLSQGEIVGVGSHRVLGNESDLIACWPMREGEGVLAKDVVSGRDADLHGGKWIVDGPSLSSSLDLLNTSEVGPAQGMIAWYPLIGDTLDYAGTNHAVNNGAVATADGHEFHGEGHLLAGFTPGESTLGKRFTWTWWDRPSRFASNTGSHGSAGSPRLYKQWTNSSGAMRVAVGDSFWTAIPSNNIPLGEWSFFAVVFKEGEVRTYLNGQLQGTTSGVVFSGESSVAFSVGRGFSNGRHYEGVSRDHRIYNRALTPEEVAIQAKLAPNSETKSVMTPSCLYTKGQIKEVIA